MAYEDVATLVTEQQYTQFASIAADALSQYLCYDLQATSEVVDGIVAANGMTVYLPLWASEINSVEYEGDIIGFTFVPSTGDYVTDETPLNYGNVLTLEDCLMPGTVVTVKGSFGFKTLPQSVATMLAYLITAFAGIQSGDNRISSKSIEDVSVSYRDTDAMTQFPTLYATTLSKWSLCEAYRSPNGMIGTDSRLQDKPWWVTDDDLGIIGG